MKAPPIRPVNRKDIRRTVKKLIGSSDGLITDQNKLYEVVTDLAFRLIANFLGKEWVTAHVIKKRHGYLRRAEDDSEWSSEEILKYNDRIINLSELLLNLHTVYGFEKVLDQLVGGNLIETTIAELKRCENIVPE